MSAPDTAPLVIDFGGGVLGALQRHADPNSVHVLLSHLHADHCLDLPGLFVWRRYHPSPAPERGLMYGPKKTWARLGAASSPEGAEIDDFSDIFDIRHWVDKQPVQIGSLTVEPRLVTHPTESYGMRITDPAGATLVYSGDTGVCDALVELARGADVFLCEASWTHRSVPASGAAPVRHRGGSGRREGRGRRIVADAHSAVDVTRGRDQRGEGRIRRAGARGGVWGDVRRHSALMTRGTG